MSVLPRIALFLQYVLPLNSRNTQNLLTVYSPTDCTLLAVCSPTEFTEYTEPPCCMFSHRLHRFSQIGSFRGCTCLKCTNPFVVALLALLVHLRQVHPLKEPICVDLCNLWENTFSNLFREFREFCGRISRQSNLRGRVTSQSPARHARADRRCTARSGGCRTTRHGWQTAVRDVPTRARGGASGR